LSALAKALGGKAPAHVYVFEGKPYTLRVANLSAKVAIERNLLAVRIDELKLFRAATDPDVYQARLDALMVKYQDGAYSLDAPEGQRYYLGEAKLETDSEEEKARKASKAMPGQLWLASYIFGTDADTMLRMWQHDQSTVMGLCALVVREAAVSRGEDPDHPNDPATAPA